jgi:CheY-like chemotaxis protein
VPPPGSNATILVVEDDPAFRDVLIAALRFDGYRVVAAVDGLQALQWIEHDRPGLIVLDLMLPRVGGRDVRAELRAHASTRDIPVVVVTGDDADDLDDLDVSCVLRKPVTVDEVVTAVHRCLHVRQRPTDHAPFIVGRPSVLWRLRRGAHEIECIAGETPEGEVCVRIRGEATVARAATFRRAGDAIRFALHMERDLVTDGWTRVETPAPN